MLREEEMRIGSAQKIEELLSRRDHHYGKLFAEIARGLLDEVKAKEEEADRRSINLPTDGLGHIAGDSQNEEIHFPSIASIVSHCALHDNISILPTRRPEGCKEYCVVASFAQWNAPDGFCALSDQVLRLWLEFSKVNKGTLFLTAAWDEIDFSQRYRPLFDHYSRSPHHVAVILVSTTGFSPVYLGH